MAKRLQTAGGPLCLQSLLLHPPAAQGAQCSHLQVLHSRASGLTLLCKLRLSRAAQAATCCSAVLHTRLSLPCLAGTSRPATASLGRPSATAPRQSIKFAPEALVASERTSSPERTGILPGGRMSVAQALRAGSKRASMMAESLLTQLQAWLRPGLAMAMSWLGGEADLHAGWLPHYRGTGLQHASMMAASLRVQLRADTCLSVAYRDAAGHRAGYRRSSQA